MQSRTNRRCGWIIACLLCALWAQALTKTPLIRVREGQPDANAKADPNADPNAAMRVLPLILKNKHAKKQRIPWRVMDGANNTWDIYRNGTIQYGSNYLYSGGMNLNVSGSSFNLNNYEAMIRKDRQEAQFGPWKRNGLQIYRRVRVYEDVGLARWLDVFKNPGKKPVKVSVEIKTNLYGSVQAKQWTNGSDGSKKGDWWLATQTHNYRNQNDIWTMHIFADPSAKTRPTVSISGNDITYKYGQVVVPPGQAVVLCHFESYGKIGDLKDRLETGFKPYKLLRDIPANARGRILNFPPTFSFAGITVPRREDMDTIQLADAKATVRHGILKAEAMTIRTSLGEFTVPGESIACGTVSDANDAPDTLVLGDGQVLVGNLADDALLFQATDAKESSPIALKEVRTFAFAASQRRPMEIGYHGPYLSTEGGSRLAFAPEGFGLNYLCRFGSLSLRPTDIARVQFTGRGAICHRVQLINGSLLAGIIRDSAIRVDLRLGRTVSIDRHELTALSFADQLDVNPFLTRIELTNDDVLLGKLTDKSFPLRSAFGELSLSPRTIKEMTFAGKHAGAALITTWEGTELRGVLARDTIPLQLTEDLSVDVAASLCRSVARAQPLPPDQVLASAKEALAKVRSVADFDARVGELRRVGVGLVPLVENKLRGPMDPTLRRRYRELISELKGEEVNRANAPEMMFWGGGPIAIPQKGFFVAN